MEDHEIVMLIREILNENDNECAKLDQIDDLLAEEGYP